MPSVMDNTIDPTPGPTTDPTFGPTWDPTFDPTADPTYDPTLDPTEMPSYNTIDPSSPQTPSPEMDNTIDPTLTPTLSPTVDPLVEPTDWDSYIPTFNPTPEPSNDNTIDPSPGPTIDPTFNPTELPSYNTIDPSLLRTPSPTEFHQESAFVWFWQPMSSMDLLRLFGILVVFVSCCLTVRGCLQSDRDYRNPSVSGDRMKDVIHDSNDCTDSECDLEQPMNEENRKFLVQELPVNDY